MGWYGYGPRREVLDHWVDWKRVYGHNREAASMQLPGRLQGKPMQACHLREPSVNLPNSKKHC